MAGAKISVELDDRQVLAALGELIERMDRPETVFADIGKYLLLAHEERFERQESPHGDPWLPLDPEYQRRKKKNADRILVLDGYLAGLLRYDASSEGLEFGTDRIYGATHQFGRPEAGIPARPFLGLSGADQAAVLDIVQDYLRPGR